LRHQPVSAEKDTKSGSGSLDQCFGVIHHIRSGYRAAMRLRAPEASVMSHIDPLSIRLKMRQAWLLISSGRCGVPARPR
jgi:hypothetical protein